MVLQGLILVATMSGGSAAAAGQPLPSNEPHAALRACPGDPEEQAAACMAAPGEAWSPQSHEQASLAADPGLRAAADAWNRESDATVLRHARALAARGDADDLVAAALLAHGGLIGPEHRQPEQARAWLRAAADRRPTAPLALWLQATGCLGMQSGHCDADAAAARLLATDGGNGAAHLLAFSRAWQASDIAAARTHLRLAGSAPRFQPYATGALQALEGARQSLPDVAMTPELGAFFGQVYGLGQPVGASDINAMRFTASWAALPLPAYGPLLDACDPERPQLRRDAGLRQDCIALLERLAEDGGTLLHSLIVLPLLSRLTAGQPAGKHWREQLRQLYWLRQSITRYPPGLPGSHVTSGEYFGWLARDGELEAMRQLLSRNGVATEPPVGWLPDDPGRRALVTSGNAPD